MSTPRKGKPFEFEGFSGEPWKETLHSAMLRTELSDSAAFEAVFALAPESIAKLSLAQIPKEVKVKCSGRGVFSGLLQSFERVGTAQVKLLYQDRFCLAQRVYESEYLKEQSLEDLLRFVSGLVGMDYKAVGNFSDALPGINLTGRSFHELLATLSERFGFSVVPRSYTGELFFVRLGSKAASVTLNVAQLESIVGVSHRSSSQHFFDSAEVRFFNPQKAAAQKRELGQVGIYEPLGFQKGHASFSERSRWPLAKGRMETVEADESHYQLGARYLQSALSKRASGQEELVLTSSELLALPGDALDLSKVGMKALEGQYLVKSCRLKFHASHPQIETVGVRA